MTRKPAKAPVWMPNWGGHTVELEPATNPPFGAETAYTVYIDNTEVGIVWSGYGSLQRTHPGTRIRKVTARRLFWHAGADSYRDRYETRNDAIYQLLPRR